MYANCYGQQESLFQQYYINPYIYSPAFSGFNSSEITILRSQKWADFDGGLISNSASFNTRINESNSSVGIKINTDEVGLTNLFKASFSYAYRIKINDDIILQPGIGVGLIDQKINFSGVNNPGFDPALFNTISNSQTALDANFGLHLKYKKLNLGVAIPHLLGNKLSINESGSNNYNLERQFIVYSNYQFSFKNLSKLVLQPDLLLIHSPDLPFHYSASIITHYKNVGWLGLTYKSDYAIGTNVGLSIIDNLKIGFAYDIQVGKLNSIAKSNNFEVLLNYVINNKKQSKNTEVESDKLETRIKEIVKNQELKDSIHMVEIDSLNSQISIKTIENKVLEDENLLIKENNTSLEQYVQNKNNTQTNNSNSNENNSQEESNSNNQNTNQSENNSLNENNSQNENNSVNETNSNGNNNNTDNKTENSNSNNNQNGNETNSNPENKIASNHIKVEQTQDKSSPSDSIQTNSIRIKDDYFIDLLNNDASPNGYYVISGFYSTKTQAENLLVDVQETFPAAKIIYNSRNEKYYIVLFYSKRIDGVIDSLIKSHDIKTVGFSKAWVLNYFNQGNQ